MSVCFYSVLVFFFFPSRGSRKYYGIVLAFTSHLSFPVQKREEYLYRAMRCVGGRRSSMHACIIVKGKLTFEVVVG